jgi:hypothetical protein
VLLLAGGGTVNLLDAVAHFLDIEAQQAEDDERSRAFVAAAAACREAKVLRSNVKHVQVVTARRTTDAALSVCKAMAASMEAER